MKIDFIKKELDALLDISKENIDRLVERDIKLTDIDNKGKDMVKMSLKFKNSSKELIPWYRRYQYEIGGVSILTIISVFLL